MGVGWGWRGGGGGGGGVAGVGGVHEGVGGVLREEGPMKWERIAYVCSSHSRALSAIMATNFCVRRPQPRAASAPMAVAAAAVTSISLAIMTVSR